jgi:hypothetical protein
MHARMAVAACLLARAPSELNTQRPVTARNGPCSLPGRLILTTCCFCFVFLFPYPLSAEVCLCKKRGSIGHWQQVSIHGRFDKKAILAGFPRQPRYPFAKGESVLFHEEKGTEDQKHNLQHAYTNISSLYASQRFRPGFVSTTKHLLLDLGRRYGHDCLFYGKGGKGCGCSYFLFG